MDPVTGKVREKEHIGSGSTIEVQAKKTEELTRNANSMEAAAPDVNIQGSRERDSQKTRTLKKAKINIMENMPPVYAMKGDIFDEVELAEDKEPRESVEMKDIRLKIGRVQEFLSAPMPPLSAEPRDEEKYREELKASCQSAGLLYSDLVASLEEWLGKKEALEDYSRERYEVIRLMKEQIQGEAERFEASLTDYREMMTGSPEALEAKEVTWADMLRHERAEQIDFDAEKIKTSSEGAGTSDIIKFERQGKTYYFKAEENMATGSFSELAHKTAVEQDLDGKLFEGFSRAVNDTIRSEQGVRLWENMRDIFNYMRADVTHLLDKKASPLNAFIRSIPKLHRPQFKQFFLEAYKKENCRSIAGESAQIKEGRNLSRRNVATSRLAKLLGIEDLIAASRTVVIKKDGRRIRGNVMDQAKGQEEGAIKRIKSTYSEEAEDQLICLQYFDLICGQIDRHYGNFLLDTEDKTEGGAKTINGICAIDNDMSFGNMDFKTAAKGVNRLRRLRQDMVKLMPEKFKSSVMALEPSIASLLLRDLLEPDELKSLEDRIKGLQEYIQKADALDEAEIQKKLEAGESEAELRDRKLAKLKFMVKISKEPAKKIRDQYRVQSAAGMEKATLFSGYFTATEKEYLDRIEQRRAELKNDGPADQA